MDTSDWIVAPRNYENEKTAMRVKMAFADEDASMVLHPLSSSSFATSPSSLNGENPPPVPNGSREEEEEKKKKETAAAPPLVPVAVAAAATTTPVKVRVTRLLRDCCAE